MAMSPAWLMPLLAGVATVVFLWFYRPAYAPPTTATAAKTQEKQRGVQLRQVNSQAGDDDEPEKGIDIIAVHGLDTGSPETWEYKTKDGRKVNWLQDEHMLPTEVSNARIFTCDWPAELFETLDAEADTIQELALRLLAGIQARPSTTNKRLSHKDRPILFIASCLGGIILAKALVMAKNEYQPVQNATRGIIFLATPFRGTSFEDVARWAEPGLRTWASIRGRRVASLLGWVKSSKFDLTLLVNEFTQLCDNKNHDGYKVLNFYEAGYTDLRAKVPLLSCLLPRSKKQLVSKSSAVLDCVPNPLRLERTHVLMNKFCGPKAGDPDYKLVVDKVLDILEDIRKGTPLEQADAWIRKYYSKKRLNIERISGEPLPMGQCYINLALVETPREDDSKQRSKDYPLQSEQFSLAARLKVETPHKNLQVELSKLFEPRKQTDNRMKEPKRILIRGRAGVGKTTLCKKIVHDFTYGTMWNDKFDRLLWIPLRNLKHEARTNTPGYNMHDLFCHEFFGSGATDLAKALSQEIVQKKTLLLLDGLDEVWNDVKHDMRRFLKDLLNQPNLIVTSRPHVVLPKSLGLDLELETVGFYTAQIGEYLRVSLDSTTIPKVESFLQSHHLVRDLVRIPIQLDAFCFTWNVENSPTPQTMTAFYSAIVVKLYSKDAIQLGKLDEGQVEQARPWDIKNVMDNEVKFLEALAFSGMHTDRIDFEPKFRGEVLAYVTKKEIPLLDGKVPSTSFLRTQDLSSSAQDQSYHFLHLTFQEYFAARYFVQRWTETQSLEYLVPGKKRAESISPVAYLQKHKYNTRYDIMWRFVAGILNEEGEDETSRFFKEIEEEPIDVLGPAHQRLVMHCLNEAPDLPTGLREQSEKRLLQWVLFERDFTLSSSFTKASELPEGVLNSALSAYGHKGFFLSALRISQRHLSDTTMAALMELFKDKGIDAYSIRRSAAGVVANQSTLSDTTMAALVGLFKDESWDLRQSAAGAIGKQTTLSDTTMAALVGLFKDEYWNVRRSAAEAIGNQSTLSDTTIAALVELFKDEDSYIRQSATEAIKKQSTLSDKILDALGLPVHLEEHTQSVPYSFRRSGDVESFYETFLHRSFNEHFSLYADGDFCIVNQGSGLRMATMKDQTQFQMAVKRGRHKLEKSDSYCLWSIPDE